MNLKTKAGKFEDKEFAYLALPECSPRNDEELYAAIRKAGQAVIQPFDGASFTLKASIILSPEEFEAKWQGD